MSKLEDDVSEILQRVARIETKIERMEALENRVSLLEAQANQAKGKATIMTVIAGFLGALVGALASILIGRLG